MMKKTITVIAINLLIQLHYYQICCIQTVLLVIWLNVLKLKKETLNTRVYVT
jgi:hypothetical protein